MMKRAKGEGIVRYGKSKPDDFHAKYEHMMGGSGLIGFLQILALRQRHPGLRECPGSLRGSPDTRDMPKRYRHADGRCLARFE